MRVNEVLHEFIVRFKVVQEEMAQRQSHHSVQRSVLP